MSNAKRTCSPDKAKSYSPLSSVDQEEYGALEEDIRATVRRLSQYDKWDYNEEMEVYLRRLPKVELHVHLDGSFDPCLLFEHLQSSSPDCYESIPMESILPWDQSKFPIRESIQKCTNETDFGKLTSCRGKYSLHEMIKAFEVFIPIVRGNMALIQSMAYDFVKRQAQQNIVYTEVRYSPHLLATGSSLSGAETVDPVPVLNAVTKGLRLGEKEFGVKVNQILCCIAWRPDWAQEVVQIAHEKRDDVPCAIVGVDIAAGEEHFDRERFPHLHDSHLKAFQRAQALGLNVTMHAGEIGDAENVSRALNEYGATRIGHGYRIIGDLEFLKDLSSLGVHFEACPTSSVETGGWDTGRMQNKSQVEKDWKLHPAAVMIKNGLKVGFNSDDPAVFNTSLTWQLRIAVGKMGLSRKCISDSMIHAIDASFIREDEKEILRSKIAQFVKIYENDCNIEKKENYQISTLSAERVMD